MANVIQIRNGDTTPTTTNLNSYELGYVRGGNLYINNNGTIVQLTDVNANGLVDSNGYLKIKTIAATTASTGRILVCDSSNTIYYKTPANIRTEIGAYATSGGTIRGNATIIGSATIYGTLTANGTFKVGSNNYGTSLPSSGTEGQVFFLLV